MLFYLEFRLHFHPTWRNKSDSMLKYLSIYALSVSTLLILIIHNAPLSLKLLPLLVIVWFCPSITITICAIKPTKFIRIRFLCGRYLSRIGSSVISLILYGRGLSLSSVLDIINQRLCLFLFMFCGLFTDQTGSYCHNTLYNLFPPTRSLNI